MIIFVLSRVGVVVLEATAGLVVFTITRRKKADTDTRMEHTNPD